jgi:hypothetical protein
VVREYPSMVTTCVPDTSLTTMVDAVGALLLVTTAGVEEMVMHGCGRTTKPFDLKKVRLSLRKLNRWR